MGIDFTQITSYQRYKLIRDEFVVHLPDEGMAKQMHAREGPIDAGR